MRTTIQRWGRGLAVILAALALTACTFGCEPAYDAAIADEVTGLTAQTLTLFQDFVPVPKGEHVDRAAQYRALTARAETIRLMAEARGSAVPASGLALRLTRLAARFSDAERTLPGGLEQAAERLDEYSEATPAYMRDYIRNLAALEAHDTAATGDQGAKLAKHQAAMATHERLLQDYLEAFRLWQAGAGPEPQQPGPPPQAPRLGLDPDLIALRLIALEDILRDTLIYERDILNRDR